ncbi:MAG: cyclopropane-fatty-acyl-phospholipid synthase [Gammaproteobacteria bacterium]|nr:cyclopropane-fatty-acyl-phospholipid synthase [Gammaproteobacteria bacterium]
MATPRRLLHRALDGLDDGQVTLAEGANATVHGDGQPCVRIEVHRPAFYRRVILGGVLGAAESYIDGDWDCDDLVALVRLVAHSRRTQQAVDRKRRFASCIDRWQHHRRRNTRRGSASNIAAHYDLGNEFFRLFLDERMMYSCALYEQASASLDVAATAKLELLCRKLRLRPEDHLLEIGGGWGGLAVYAAKRHGCRVTTATLSPAQYAHTVSLVRQHRLEDRVEVQLRDYRDLVGQFDKLVSVEMIEAVGHRFLPDYFRACARLLKPDGLMALQAITIRDQRYRQALHSVDFIKKHIFPGGFIPCVSVLVENAARQCDAVLVHLDDLGADYARTLRAWRTRFDAQADAIKSLGFDERFRRMWRFYFCYCEGGFLERAISDVQMLFAMPAYRGPVRLPAQEAAA